MTNATAENTFTDSGFESYLSNLDEPGWLTDSRRQAWQTFQDSAWPARRSEEWMRTDIGLFDLEQFPFAPSHHLSSPPDGLLSLGVELGGNSQSVNGNITQRNLSQDLAGKGVIFDSLGEVAKSNPEIIQKHLLKRAVNPNYDRFATLHTACWTNSNVLYVPRGVVVDKPIHLQSILAENGSDLGHLLVVLEDGAEATVLAETTSADDTPGLHCGATELIVGNGANLRFVNFQNWNSKVWHFSHQGAVVDQDANLQWTVGALGSRLAKVNQHVRLDGPGANCQVNGVMFTERRQHLAYHTLQHHAAPNCQSNFLYKAALQDKSRTVWRGMIQVDPAAQKTNGYQRNDNLLLSNNARADSIPGLEIEADDVRCTHGSTSGQVDEELIFYACCRGFTRQEAIRMIVTGFFQQIFDRITIESVRDALGLAIARRVREYE